MHKRRWSSTNWRIEISESAPGSGDQYRVKSTLAILEFFVPGHLNRFKLGFVGSLRIAGEAGKLRDPFVHVREANGERIGVREFVAECDGDVFDGIPIKSGWHSELLGDAM